MDDVQGFDRGVERPRRDSLPALTGEKAAEAAGSDGSTEIRRRCRCHDESMYKQTGGWACAIKARERSRRYYAERLAREARHKRSQWVIRRLERIRAEVGEDACWVWDRYVSADGYGSTREGSVHRLAYEHWIGRIPRKMNHLHHLCGTKPCGNPWHLKPMVPHLHVSMHKQGAA